MNSIENLLEAVSTFYHDYGRYPVVEVSPEFFDNHAWDIDKLTKDGVDVRVVDKFHFRSFNIIRPSKGQNIDTLDDLKRIVDRLINEGKGHWPVRGVPPDANIFIPVHLYPIIPGDKPEEHDLENEITVGYPESEYIRVYMGDIDG